MRHGKMAMVWGEMEPAFSIGYCAPQWGTDSGLTILMSDSPDPEDVEPGDPRISFVCVSCLLAADPGLGRGIAIAKEYGVSDLDDDGEWVVGDLSRLEPAAG